MKNINKLFLILGVIVIISILAVYYLGLNYNIIGIVLIGFIAGFGILCGLEDPKLNSNKNIQSWLNKK